MAEYYSNEPTNREKNDNGTLPLVMGILSLVFSLTVSRVLALIFGIIAVVKGSKYKSEDKDARYGFILGLIGLCLSAIVIFGFLLVVAGIVLIQANTIF